MGEDPETAISKDCSKSCLCRYLRRETIVPVASKALSGRFPVEVPLDLSKAPLLHLATRPKLWNEWFSMNGIDVSGAFHDNPL